MFTQDSQYNKNEDYRGNKMNNNIKRVAHTGITVRNLEASIEFYQNVLGLELIQEPTEKIMSEELDIGIGVSGVILRVAIFKIGDGILELLQYHNPTSPIEKSLPPNSLGSMHIAMEVNDIYAKIEELEDKGVIFNSKPNTITEGALSGCKWAYFKDIDGILIELVEFNLK